MEEFVHGRCTPIFRAPEAIQGSLSWAESLGTKWQSFRCLALWDPTSMCFCLGGDMVDYPNRKNEREWYTIVWLFLLVSEIEPRENVTARPTFLSSTLKIILKPCSFGPIFVEGFSYRHMFVLFGPGSPSYSQVADVHLRWPIGWGSQRYTCGIGWWKDGEAIDPAGKLNHT